MDYKIYVGRFVDGSYYGDNLKQICLKKDAKRMTWKEAENIRDKNNRISRKGAVVEPA